MRVEIEGVALPGARGVEVGVQRRAEVVDRHRADGETAFWSFDVDVATLPDGSLDARGPYVHGRPGARFLYLSWGTAAGRTFVMFQRAKLMFDGVPADVMEAAQESKLVGKLGLTMDDGSPLCAAVRPPAITWTAG